MRLLSATLRALLQGVNGAINARFFFKEKSIINPVGCSETATLLSTSTTLSCPRARSEKVALFISSAKQCDPREGKSHGKGPDGDFSTCFFFVLRFEIFISVRLPACPRAASHGDPHSTKEKVSPAWPYFFLSLSLFSRR